MPANKIYLPPTYGLQQAPVFDMGLVVAGANFTGNQNSQDVNTLNFKGLTVILDVSAIGAGSLTVVVQGKDFSNSGNYFPLLTSSAITANGTTSHTIYPGITAATGVNGNTSVSMILPVWLRIAVNGASASSYTVGAILTT